MALRGRKSSLWILALVAAVLAASAGAAAEPQTAEQWVWAGQAAPPHGDRVLYVLQGEVRAAHGVTVMERQGLYPYPLRAPAIHLVYRLRTLAGQEAFANAALGQVVRWEAHGVKVAGIQLDFDAPTGGLGLYRDYVSALRQRLPRVLGLSVTGLLDWAANADPAALAELGRDADEVVFQMYRGRQPVVNLPAYLPAIARLAIPFKIGLLPGMDTAGPEWDRVFQHPLFHGTVVFPVTERRRRG